MNHEQPHSRRASSNYPTTSPAYIPRAPPLPTPKPLQRARDAASRFLGYTSRPPSPRGERDEDRFAPGSGRFTRFAPLRLTQNATAIHRTGLEIKTIAINEKGSHALIGGKEIFKTVKVEDGRCTEDFNLRAAIRSTPTHASGRTREIYNIDIADVAWAKGECGDYVAAATSSGKIILYDLGHAVRAAGLQAAQLHEHARQVHKVTFNPHKGNLLLSGSQDGTVRLWDLRDVRSQVTAMQSRRKYAGQNAPPVRDVKWSPTEGLDFACGTDSGEIQRWDMRNLKAPKVNISAHSLACNAVDWHPDGKHIIGASSDKTVRVFDVSINRPKKAMWEIKTPYPVLNARWRPSCESLMHHDNGARLCAQVVTVYDREHPTVHVWDYRRPHLPFREVEPYPSAPTDFIWHSQDLLWTVGREGIFLQNDIQHMPKVIEKRHLQAFAISPLSEVSIVAQQRNSLLNTETRPWNSPLQTRTGNSLAASPDSSSLSRSWADDSLDHTFLSIFPRKRISRSNSNNRVVGQSAVSSSNHSPPPVIKLDDILLHRKSFAPQQVACRGQLPGHNKLKPIALMAGRCTADIPRDVIDEELITEVDKAFKDNAQWAQAIGFYQLSQTWKLAGFCTVKHLKERATLKSKRATETQTIPSESNTIETLHSLATRLAAQDLNSPTQSPASIRPVSTIAQQLTVPESSSNVPTPLARPIVADDTPDSPQRPRLPDLDNDETIELPPSLAPAHLMKVAQAEQSQPNLSRRLTVGNLTDLDRQQSNGENDNSVAKVKHWKTRPNPQLDLGMVGFDSLVRPKLEKHDSDESFQFLAGSTDSRGPSFPASFESSSSDDAKLVAEHPSRPKPTWRPPVNERVSDGDKEQSSALDQSMPFEGSGTLANSNTLNRFDDSIHASKEQIQEGATGLPRLNLEQSPEQTSHQHGEHIAALNERLSVDDPEKPELLEPRSAGLDISTTHTIPGARDSHAVKTPLAVPAIHKAPNSLSKPTGILSSSIGRLRDEADIDIEEGKPWSLLEMLQEMLRYYTQDSPYPQVASLLLLLLGPLLPRTHPLPDKEIHQTISSYVDYFLNSLSSSPDDIPSLINACFEQPIKSGLQPLQIEAILSSYHEQLLSMRLYDEATLLRKLAYPAYPAVYADFTLDNHIHLKCGGCSKPLIEGMAQLRCETCRVKQAACHICWLQRSPFEDGSERSAGLSRLLSTCLTCGHSGHAACYHHWFVECREAGCPTPTCFCPCVVRP